MEKDSKETANFVPFNLITLKITSRVENPLNSRNEFQRIIRQSSSAEVINIEMYQKADDSSESVITGNSKQRLIEIQKCYIDISHENPEILIDALNELIDHFKDFEYTLEIASLKIV